MKKLKTQKAVTIVSIVLFVIAVYLFYSRPMTIQQRYPMLTLEKCSGLNIYYRDDTMVDLEKFTVDKNCEEFDVLCDLLYEQEYCRSIRDLLPRGTRTHRVESGDFQWEVCFRFEDIEFPDSSIGSGEMLRIQSWYGDLDIYFDGERLSCYTNEQEYWGKEIFGIIHKFQFARGA